MPLDIDKAESEAPKGGRVGAPEIKITDLPQEVLLEAAGRLSLALGVGVPLEDYAEAACLLLEALPNYGWEFFRPVSGIQAQDK